MSGEVLRVGFVPGVSPDKWARSWRERRDGVRLELVPVTEEDAEPSVRSGAVDMVLAEAPVEVTGLHVVRLYQEVAVVVTSREHPAAAYEEMELADLVGEQFVGGPPAGFDPGVRQLDFPTMSAEDAVAVAASGSAVAILPLSLARLHHRRDAVHRPVRDLSARTIALLWPVERDDDTTQAFVGVVRGRTPRSSRG